VSSTDPSAEGRFSWLALALGRLAAIGAAVVVAVGVVAVLVAWLAHRGVASSMALAYYFCGSLLFLVGTFPTGGFRMLRPSTRRRPIGAGPKPLPLLGLVLIAAGALFDLTRPF
jgi:uncharacterized membrane protein YedE/YeeE